MDDEDLQQHRSRLRHEQFVQRFVPHSNPTNAGRSRLDWVNLSLRPLGRDERDRLSEGRESPGWRSYLYPTFWEWEYWTDNGSPTFFDNIKEYAESGRMLSSGVEQFQVDAVLDLFDNESGEASDEERTE